MIKNKRLVFGGIGLILVGLAALGALCSLSLKNNSANQAPVEALNPPAPKLEKKPEQSKVNLDIKAPSSLNVLVNKKVGLNPATYRPVDLVVPNIKVSPDDSKDEQSVREVIRADLEEMIKDSTKQNLSLVMNSGFRSFELQAFYFNNYVRSYGEAEARKFSAQPGFSEHQTGLSFDMSTSDKKCYLEICFAETKAGIWLAENSYKYGFILRYPEGKEEITGYQFEPWHFRFVGKDVAKEVFDKKVTYE
jgi:D-alanyl-D-alanine carboxypeptidase